MAEPDTTRDVVTAILAMHREPGYDFPGRVASALASVAAELGSTAALVASRPGSWEAAHILQLVHGTVGWEDEYLAEHKMEGLPGA